MAKQRLLPGLLGPVCEDVPLKPQRRDTGSHKTKKLSIPKNVELEFLPSYSPDLNRLNGPSRTSKTPSGLTSTSIWRTCGKRPERFFPSCTDEAVASLIGYDYLLEAASIGLS